VENTRVVSVKHLRYLIGLRGGQPTHLMVLRDGKDLTLVVTPTYDTSEKAF